MIETDVLIVGAGPSGLFQVFELGLLDVKAHVVDSLKVPGGQCAELYPDKPIYDIPAFPIVSARELVERLLEQIAPFSPVFHFGQEVQSLRRGEDGTFELSTSGGERFRARAVIIAGGLGSFQPRRLRLVGADALEGQQIHYRVTEPARFKGCDLVILGGGDSALDWSLELYRDARSLQLIHRRAQYRAQLASVKSLMEICENNDKVDAAHGNVTALHCGQDGRLEAIELQGPDSVSRRVPLDHLLVFWGMHPKLGPIAEWGLGLNRNQIEVGTQDFQTSEPGIFAVGDINTYPGKKKLILSGFHEAALAAFGVRQYLYPDERVFMQYTTTSSTLHRRLGVQNG